MSATLSELCDDSMTILERKARNGESAARSQLTCSAYAGTLSRMATTTTTHADLVTLHTVDGPDVTSRVGATATSSSPKSPRSGWSGVTSKKKHSARNVYRRISANAG